jgi:hypothetical protein
MSWSKFDDDCPGCKPAMSTVKTGPDGQPIIINGMVQVGEPLPDDDPKVVAMIKVWNETTTLQERKAYHAVCCMNSQLPSDRRLAEGIFRRMQAALEALPKES